MPEVLNMMARSYGRLASAYLSHISTYAIRKFAGYLRAL
jgi:hypothetical protein